MTSAESLALVKASAPYTAAGNLEAAFTRWRAANPKEAMKLLEHLDALIRGQEHTAPDLQTKFGRGVLGLLPTSTATSPVPTRPVRIKGAMVVTAGNCDPNLLRQAGITHVAPEITDTNMTDLFTPRWDGFQKGGFVVARALTTAAVRQEALVAATRAHIEGLAFLVMDTEAHKADMGGSLDLTEALFSQLRTDLGPGFRLYNVTFGIHSSPAVVNHDALRKHNVKAIWETYGGDGATLGVAQTVAKANAEGWSPAHVALGDKSLAVEVAEARALSGLGDVWAWAPEQAGVDVLELAKVSV